MTTLSERIEREDEEDRLAALRPADAMEALKQAHSAWIKQQLELITRKFI